MQDCEVGSHSDSRHFQYTHSDSDSTSLHSTPPLPLRPFHTYPKGGLHAAMIASLLPFELAVVSWLGPPSAEPVFTEGVLARACEWKNLAKLAGGFSKLGLDADMVGKFVPVILAFVTRKGGAGVGSIVIVSVPCGGGAF